MGILVLKILAIWCLVALATGLGLGMAIRRGDRIRKDEFLKSVLAALEATQASRG